MSNDIDNDMTEPPHGVTFALGLLAGCDRGGGGAAGVAAMRGSLHKNFLGTATATLAVCLIAAPALAWSPWESSASLGLPNPSMTPGAINPAVTQWNIGSTICRRGWSRTVRPPERYTEELKWRQIRAYGYRDRYLRDYEEDHLIPLELGGAPADPRNLWPEPRRVLGGWGSRRKDRLEDRLRELVCAGRLSLDAARWQIARNWIAAYRRYMGGF